MKFGLNWLKIDKYLIILVIIGIIFLFAYSWLYIGIEPKFTWPDETANYYFTKLFAEKNQLRSYEPLNQIADGLIRTRSTGFANGYVVPGSFLGMILIYGLIAKIFGSWVILYLTPLLAVIGVLFFYLLIKEVFGKKIAFISSLLLFVLPSYWYYTAHGMLHNILFVSLLIIGFYFLVKVLNSKEKTDNSWLIYLLSGFFIGLALITRTSEITWIFVILIILFILRWKKIGWINLMIFLGVVILIFIPILYLNHQIYGSSTSFAYSNNTVDNNSLESVSSTIFLKLKQLILPFGLNFNQIGISAYQYLIIIFPWFSILLIVSFIWLLRNVILIWLKKIFPEINFNFEFTASQKKYLWLYTFMALWLVIYYGSWEFYEHFDKSQIILGTSYLRYWLPIYIFGLPIIILFLMNLRGYFKKRWLGNLLTMFIIFLLVYFSVNTIILDPIQGLTKTKGYLKEAIKKRDGIVSLTENDSVIISGFNDKVFFPERKVIVKISGGDESREILNSLTERVPVYFFYNSLDNNSRESSTFFFQYHIKMKEVKNFPEYNEVLYRIEGN